MTTEISNTICLACGFLSLFGIAELIYYVFKPKAEYTRKLVHFGTGIITLLFPVLLTSAWSVLFLCGSFALILIVSLKFNFLKSINAIDRKSHGSISYPVAVFGTFMFFLYQRNDDQHTNLVNFYLPILMLAICDPIAALTGKRWPIKQFKVGDGHKSLMGTGMFFISAFVLCFLLFWKFKTGFDLSDRIVSAFILALLGTVAEAISPKGLDNITIPGAEVIGLILIDYLI